MTINIEILQSPTAPLDFSNATMKMVSNCLSAVISRLGYSNPSKIKNIIESGGCGAIPLAALLDDVNEFRKKLTPEATLGNVVTLSCIGSEIGFDLYELASSISQYCDLEILKQACDSVSTGVMTTKVLGSIPLAILTADEAYAQIFERAGFLGSMPIQDKAFERKLGSLLRASEAGFAALSNLALLYEGAGGPMYTATSSAANLFKFSRMACNQTLGV